MNARWQIALLVALYCSLGASARTENFIVSAPTPQFANEVAQAAEGYRRELATEWLGHELPRWTHPCPITVKVGRMGAGGATSFMFERGQPFGWQMSIQGSRERIMDSVLPHEVTHTIFATHFGRPLPRWADEGACTIVEHASERNRQHHMLIRFLTSAPSRGIPFNRMFAMTEYPADIMPLYSQGYSLVRYLISQGGKRKFVDYVGAGMQTNDWEAATQQFYGFGDLSDLQLSWVAWVRDGYPDVGARNPEAIARASATGRANDSGIVAIRDRVSGETNEESARARPDVDRVAANRSNGGSWYARQAATRASTKPILDRAESGSPRGLDPLDFEPTTPLRLNQVRAGSNVSRPQPMQSLQQPMVMQWSRVPAALHPIPRSMPLPAGGTVWR